MKNGNEGRRSAGLVYRFSRSERTTLVSVGFQEISLPTMLQRSIKTDAIGAEGLFEVVEEASTARWSGRRLSCTEKEVFF